jgi:putative endonuclease
MYTNQELGQLGEKLAKRFLEEREYEIICQNFKSKQGEIDIIAKDKNKTMVFVEVKTRTSLEFGNPAEAVNKSKIEHILKTARYYLYSNKIKETSMRFDVIEVFIYKGRYRVNHIKQIM